jgi:hypothetical protein
MIAAELATMKKGGDRGNQHTGGKREISPLAEPLVSRDQAAEMLQVNQKTVSDSNIVKTKGTSEEVKSVVEGKAAVSTVAKQIRAGMSAEQRKEAREMKRPLTSIPKADKRNRKSSHGGRSQDREHKSQIWGQLREALEKLTTLPRASDVVSTVRSLNKTSAIMDARLPRALTYIKELNDAWNDARAA